MMAFDAANIPDKLKEAYREKRCAVLVGAGASVGAKLPDWGGLLASMIAVAVGHKVISGDKADEYRKLLADSSKYLMIASGLKEDIHLYFDEFIERELITPSPQPTDLHRALVQADRFQFVLTTNYDTIIERAYRAGGKPDVSVC